MPAKVKPIPEGECAATPYLSVSNATEMIDFYKKVFGAVETMANGTGEASLSSVSGGDLQFLAEP